MTWSIWLQWILVCAAIPVCQSFVKLGLGKKILPSDPHADLIWIATLGAIIVSALLPSVLIYLVFRQIAPLFKFWKWLLCIVLMVAVWLVVAFQPDLWGWTHELTRVFRIASLKLRQDGPVDFARMLALPWSNLLLPTAVYTAGFWALPPAFLGWLTGRWRQALYFWLALVVGDCIVEVIEAINRLSGTYGFNEFRSLNGKSWSRRIYQWVLLACQGGIAGAISGFGLVAMFPASRFGAAGRRWLRLVPATGAIACIGLIAGLWGAGVAVAYLSGPKGLRAGLPELRKALTFAPEVDQSAGEQVLSYSHSAQFETYSYVRVEFAPDGKSFLAQSVRRRLVHVELSSGRVLGYVGRAYGRHENIDYRWTPDGRHILVRSYGKPVKTKGMRYMRHQNDLRAYAIPDYRETASLDHSGERCLVDNLRDKSMVSDKKGSWWILCGQVGQPESSGLFAI